MLSILLISKGSVISYDATSLIISSLPISHNSCIRASGGLVPVLLHSKHRFSLISSNFILYFQVK